MDENAFGCPRRPVTQNFALAVCSGRIPIRKQLLRDGKIDKSHAALQYTMCNKSLLRLSIVPSQACFACNLTDYTSTATQMITRGQKGCSLSRPELLVVPRMRCPDQRKLVSSITVSARRSLTIVIGTAVANALMNLLDNAKSEVSYSSNLHLCF